MGSTHKPAVQTLERDTLTALDRLVDFIQESIYHLIHCLQLGCSRGACATPGEKRFDGANRVLPGAAKELALPGREWSGFPGLASDRERSG